MYHVMPICRPLVVLVCNPRYACPMKTKTADMQGKDCVKVAVRVRPFNKVSVCLGIYF